MKSFSLIGLVSLLFLLGSCCYKKQCDGNNNLAEIQLRDFPGTHIDTVFVTAYMKNSDFTVPDGKYLTHAATDPSRDQFLYVSLPLDLNVYHDYKIEIPSLNLSYSITAISFGKEVCNKCPTWHNYYEELKSYELNGQLLFSNYFYVKF